MPTILEIISDMLAYEAVQFDAICPKCHGTGKQPEECAIEGFLEPCQACNGSGEANSDLDVSGADLVDAFSEWRTQLKAALQDEATWIAGLLEVQSVGQADMVAARLLQALGYGAFVAAWREQVDGQENADHCTVCGLEAGSGHLPGCVNGDDERCRICGAVPGTSEYGTVGDGWDGMCGSCADKAEADEEEAQLDEQAIGEAERAVGADIRPQPDSASDPWHVGGLPGDEDGRVIRDANGLTVFIASTADVAKRAVALHNSGESTDEL